MIVDKYKPLDPEEENAIKQTVTDSTVSQEQELYATNALCEVFNAVKNILGDLKLNDQDPNSPPLFRTIKLNNGQLSRLKNNKWNKEYAIAFPAVFLHFIDVRYLVQQSRVGEGRATMRIQYVLNRLNNSDTDFELEGYALFQKINAAIQDRKKEFPALTERFQLTYFDQPESFDDFMGEGTGAARIFGTTGGVMEAALRTVVWKLTGGQVDPIDYHAARGYRGVKEASVWIGDLEVKVAIVNGIGNVKAVMDDVRAGKSPYHFIEVMACPGGCLNGGGAPLLSEPVQVADRMKKMYDSDEKNPVRRSHENVQVQKLYEEYLKEPCGHISHHLLHTHYVDRSGEVK